MIRTQIQLTEEQAGRLRRLAAERGLSVSALTRQAIDKLLDELDDAGWEERRRRALSIIGIFRDEEGRTDVAAEHDRYLTDAVWEHKGKRG